MAVELRLKKTDKAAFGFRLAGGADFDVPLTVIKVNPGSIAEDAGMQTGDVVVRVNDTAVSDLTHLEAHDVIVSAGDDFIVAVRRGDLSDLPPRLLMCDTDTDEEKSEKVDVIRESLEGRSETVKEKCKVTVKDPDLNITDEEIVKIIGEHVQVTTKTTENFSAKSEVSKLISEQEIQQQESQERKWSTFLQKPKHPKPIVKKKIEVGASKAPPYKVVIKKQPKKEERLRMEEEKRISEEKKEELNEAEEVKDGEREVTAEEEQLGKLEEDETIEEDKEEEIETVDDNNNTNEFGEMQESKPNEEDEEIDENEEIKLEKKLSMNLEEQLAEVQKQLLALSKLPSTIQQTLNAVTRQLSELVAASQEISADASVRMEEEESTGTHTEELTESLGHQDQPLSVVEEEESYEERRVTFEDRCNESDDEQALFEALERECEEGREEEEPQMVTEEEVEARRAEQEKQEKKEKGCRRSSVQGSVNQPLTPLQRPIILPGGRKWSQPDDVESKLRRPSLTDEKIANTINSYTEVIVGRTMGINFLKYQPPPKNLDYLQKSAVYRLIHDIEPPPKGIIARDVKVLAEQDYYAEKREDPQLPPQMER